MLYYLTVNVALSISHIELQRECELEQRYMFKKKPSTHLMNMNEFP